MRIFKEYPEYSWGEGGWTDGSISIPCPSEVPATGFPSPSLATFAILRGCWQSMCNLDHAKAINMLSAAIMVDSTCWLSWWYRGACFVEEGIYSKATYNFKTAYSLSPQEPWLLLSLGHTYMSNGQIDSALETFNEGIHVDSSIIQLYFSGAIVHNETGRFDKAIRDLDHVLRQLPEIGPSFNERGKVNYAMGNYSAAKRDYREALATDRNNTDILFSLGATFKSLGDPDSTITYYSKAIELRPDSTEGYYERGLLYYEVGKYFKAHADLDSTHADVRNNLGCARLKLSFYPEALESFNHAIALDNNAGEYNANRAAAFVFLEEYSTLLEELTTALNLGTQKKHWSTIYAA